MESEKRNIKEEIYSKKIYTKNNSYFFSIFVDGRLNYSLSLYKSFFIIEPFLDKFLYSLRRLKMNTYYHTSIFIFDTYNTHKIIIESNEKQLEIYKDDIDEFIYQLENVIYLIKSLQIYGGYFEYRYLSKETIQHFKKLLIHQASIKNYNSFFTEKEKCQ